MALKDRSYKRLRAGSMVRNERKRRQLTAAAKPGGSMLRNGANRSILSTLNQDRCRSHDPISNFFRILGTHSTRLLLL